MGKEEPEMFDWNVVSVQAERYKDMLHAAEVNRLLQQTQHQEARPGLRSRVLAWLGGRLVEWGCRLQHRYTSVARPGLGC
jgi:hypothetical protein